MLRKEHLDFIRALYRPRPSFLDAFERRYKKVARTRRKGGRPPVRRVVEPLARTWTVDSRAPREDDRDKAVELWERLLREGRDCPEAPSLLHELRRLEPGLAAVLPAPFHLSKSGRPNKGFPRGTKAPPTDADDQLEPTRGAGDASAQLDGFLQMMLLARELERVGLERGETSQEFLEAERELAELQAEFSDVALEVSVPRIGPPLAVGDPAPGSEQGAAGSPADSSSPRGPGRLRQFSAVGTPRAKSTAVGEVDIREGARLGRATDATDRSIEDYWTVRRRLIGAREVLKAAAHAAKWTQDLFQRRLIADPTRPDVVADLIRIVAWVQSQRASGIRFVTRRCKNKQCGALVPMLPDAVKAFCSHGCEKDHYRGSATKRRSA